MLLSLLDGGLTASELLHVPFGVERSQDARHLMLLQPWSPARSGGSAVHVDQSAHSDDRPTRAGSSPADVCVVVCAPSSVQLDALQRDVKACHAALTKTFEARRLLPSQAMHLAACAVSLRGLALQADASHSRCGHEEAPEEAGGEPAPFLLRHFHRSSQLRERASAEALSTACVLGGLADALEGVLTRVFANQGLEWADAQRLAAQWQRAAQGGWTTMARASVQQAVCSVLDGAAVAPEIVAPNSLAPATQVLAGESLSMVQEAVAAAFHIALVLLGTHLVACNQP